MDQNKLGFLLSTLYSSSDNAVIQNASRQLNAWQQTPEAWNQADQLLSAADLQPEFYYFFAQTLKTKIQYDMYQLEPGTTVALRDSLVRKLLAVVHSSAAKPTRNQLCLAIADLTIQAVDLWTTSIPDLIGLLQASHVSELLEILKLIPEETQNHKLMAENSKRSVSRQKCLENYFQVLQFLNNQFTTAKTSEIIGQILACFLSWLKFDIPPIQYSMMESPIINYCLGQVSKISPSDLSLDETAVEILSEIVNASSSYRNRGGHNPLIELKVFPQVCSLCQVLMHTNLDEALMSDEECLKAITRLLVVTADGMAVAIADQYMTNQGMQELLLVLLKLFSLKNLDLSDSISPFFEDFLNATSAHRGTGSLVHERLFEVIVARLDVSTDSSFNAADPFDSVDSDFLHFRAKVLLPILYALSRDFFGRSVGAEKLVQGLTNNVVNNQSLTLQEAFAIGVRDQLIGLNDPSPVLISAVDFLMDSILQWIDVASIHDCGLLDAFRRRALISIVGSLGSWIKTEAQLFKVIDSVAQVLIRPVVVHRSIHYAAARAFRDICFNQNAKRLIVKNPMAVESIARMTSQTAHLALREQSEVTEGITCVLSVCEDDVLFSSLMKDSILLPLIQSIDSFRCSGDAANAGNCVDRVTAVVRSLAKLRSGSPRYNMIAEVVLNGLWPSLSIAMETFRSESEFIEKSCRLLKHALRCVPDGFKRLVIPLGQLLVRDFSASHHSSYLYTAEVLVQEYGQDADMRAALTDLFARLASDGVRITHQRMTATPFGTDNVDELIEDLYGMIERFLRYSPTIVVKARDGIQAVLQLLIPVFSRIRRAETIEAVSAFTEGMFGGTWTQSIDIGTVSNEDVEAIRHSLTQIAPVLVEEIFALLVAVCSRSMRQAIPNILMVVNSFDHSAFSSDWVIRGLRRVPLSVMTDRDKQAALTALVNLEDERTVSNAVDDILYRAELVGRRIRNEIKQ